MQKPKAQFPQFGFHRTDFGGMGTIFYVSFTSSPNMIGSTVKVFFFVLYLCTSSSESLQLTTS